MRYKLSNTGIGLVELVDTTTGKWLYQNWPVYYRGKEKFGGKSYKWLKKKCVQLNKKEKSKCT